jgi:predicted RNase H-like HicB family nuclease
MLRYPAFLDGESGAYGVVFPDLAGAVAMGATLDEALVNAEEALRDYAHEMAIDGKTLSPPSDPESITVPQGAALVIIPLIQTSGKAVRANMVLDEDVLAFIDSEAKRRSMTRTAYVTWMTRRIAQAG